MKKLIIIILLLSSLNGFAGDVIFSPVIVVEPEMIDTNTEIMPGVDPNNIVLQFSDPITFNVLGGSSSVAVPTLTTWGTMLFCLMFLCVGCLVYKIKNKSLMFLSLVLIGFNVNANVYHVLLSSDTGAPSADEVMAESLISPAPPAPLISAFITAPPQEVETLVELRATEPLCQDSCGLLIKNLMKE